MKNKILRMRPEIFLFIILISIAAAFSMGNIFVAYKVQPDKEKAAAEKIREMRQTQI